MSQKEITLTEERRFAVLLSIIDLGGSAKKQDVLDNLFKKEFIYIEHKSYFKIQANGEVAWKNDLAWERKHLVDLGCIKNTTFGIWEITEKGKLMFIKLFYEKIDNTSFNFLSEPAWQRAKQLITRLNF